MSEGNKKSSINWGGIIKGALAVGAIVAGAELFAPGTVSSLAETVSNFGVEKAATAAEPNLAMKGISWLVTKAAGIALAVTGIGYLMSDKSSNHEADRAGHYHEAKESFALREDMRKMQAVMMARMQAAGHEPATQAAAPAR